ncbi:hypothetical protein AWB76_07371 [Caballeronia temeraria]|uniref:Uncharacterized protein n=1 Tax=Caballeronia temeraria TaxID=1777137 RepID=A0A158DR31_9BURK|nr:hypothetical protein AWB76_07371 [Caballeronia temeraria]
MKRMARPIATCDRCLNRPSNLRSSRLARTRATRVSSDEQCQAALRSPRKESLVSRQPGHPGDPTADANDRRHRASQAHSSSRHEALAASSAGRSDRAASARRSGGAGRQQAARGDQGARRLRQDVARARVARPAAQERRARRMDVHRCRRRRTRALPPPSRADVAAGVRRHRRIGDRPHRRRFARARAIDCRDAHQRTGRSRGRAVSLSRRLSPDQPACRARSHHVLHRACARARACRDLHARRRRAAARALAGAKRTAGNRRIDAAFQLRRNALLRRARMSGQAERHFAARALREHRRLGRRAAHFRVRAGPRGISRADGSTDAVRRVAAVRRVYRRDAEAPAGRRGRVHAAHVDRRAVERAAVRGDHRRRR